MSRGLGDVYKRQITKIDLTENYTIDFNSSNPTHLTIKENINTTTLFDAETTSANGRFIFTKSSATINNDNNLWLYFGTGNTQKLKEESAQIQNRLFGIKDKNFPNFVNVSTVGKVSNCTNSDCPVPSDKLGWYVDLQICKSTYQPSLSEGTGQSEFVQLETFPTVETFTKFGKFLSFIPKSLFCIWADSSFNFWVLPVPKYNHKLLSLFIVADDLVKINLPLAEVVSASNKVVVFIFSLIVKWVGLLELKSMV